MDSRFTAEVVSQTPNPQQTSWVASHQDYSSEFVCHSRDKWPSEEKCGELLINNLLKGGRGHFGPLEHPQIVLNVGYLPHSTMQQVRTHRVGVSFDVQSFRYTGQSIYDLGKYFSGAIDNWADDAEEVLSTAENGLDWIDEAISKVENVFYLRPVGDYSDRQGKKYTYSEGIRRQDLIWCAKAAIRYATRIDQGFSEEHARGLIPFDVRQHWVMSANVRSMMHLLDLRWKSDAQLEAQQFCEVVWPHFQAWVPAIADWYEKTRAKKARLAP